MRLTAAAALALASLAVCGAVREGASKQSPKLLKLQEEQAKKDAEWKPVSRRPPLPVWYLTRETTSANSCGLDSAEEATE